jgi:hypothetical protein
MPAALIGVGEPAMYEPGIEKSIVPQGEAPED